MVMTRWQPPEQAQAHLVLQAVLGAEGVGLREPQAHALLSSIWHQVALAGLLHRLACCFFCSGLPSRRQPALCLLSRPWLPLQRSGRAML